MSLRYGNDKNKSNIQHKDLPEYESSRGLQELITKDVDLDIDVNQLTKDDKCKYEMFREYKDNNCQITADNYRAVMKLLTEFEDIYSEMELDNCVLYDRRFTLSESPGDKQYDLDVVDVENLPSVSEGDGLLIRSMNTCDREMSFKAIIIKATFDCITFACLERSSCKLNLNETYYVRFLKDRTTVRMQMEALCSLDDDVIKNTLIPETCGQMVESNPRYNFSWCNDSVADNLEQREAVCHIYNCTAFPAPYILIGPPGTGKTTTLVEAIIQIQRNKRDCKILVVAPSNCACDEIAIRLIKFLPNRVLYRYYSKSMERRLHELHPDLVRQSNLSSGGFVFPVQVLFRYGIIVTTTTNSGRLALNGFPENYFDYIFIDECGSATEPTAVIPIGTLISHATKGATNVVIAGDPKQLGPIVACREIKQLGLGRSMLERMVKLDLYRYDSIDGNHNKNCMSKLLENYRSHGAILNIANDIFYNGELIAKAAPEFTDWALGWQHLPNKKMPIIFHVVYGTCNTDDYGQSRYNDEEVRQAAEYVRKILEDGVNGLELTQQDIGIVTPYRSQCNKIRKMLDLRGWPNIEVGSVEQFQGQERAVIIVSTVRSKSDTIGFLNDPKVS